MGEKMKSVKKFLFVFLILFFLLIPYSFPREKVYEGKIIPADNRNYFSSVYEKLKNAEKSIYVIMFLASYYPEYPNSPTNQLLNTLIEKKKKNVKVEVILDQSNAEYFQHSRTENLKTASYLSENGITVYFDLQSKTTHCKLLIIDGKYVVIGSTNWSYSAIEKNNETSVIIESEELAKYYIRYFEKVKKECKTKFVPRRTRF